MFVVYLGVQIMQLDDSDVRSVINTNMQTGSFVLIGLGGALFLICAIGFIGACCGSSCMLNFYGLLMFLLLVGNVALFFTGYKYKGQVEDSFGMGIKNAINKFQDDKTIALGLQKLQSTLQCCGWDGPTDYKSTSVPASCCNEFSSISQSTNSCSRSDIKFTQGCKFSPVVDKYLGHVIYSAVALVLTQLVIILAACCLARDIRNESSNDW